MENTEKLFQLIHNGILLPEPPPFRELYLMARGKKVMLTPKQEEMAIAWCRKIGTPYVNDVVFIRNFLQDFSRELGIAPVLRLDEIDYAAVLEAVLAERAAKEAMSKEEKKRLAAERKSAREELKERYGFAIANGQRIELANYMAEPSGIFMGRGKHPLRGRWKEGATQSDVTLNLSPDAPPVPGQWCEIVWQPDSLWVARWEDKLTGKLKYIWLHDTAPIKQAREAQKFDKAIELSSTIETVREAILQNLTSDNAKRRRIATACYLIDALCLRVGDEKDPEEADTVGATTLRPEHIKLHDNGVAEFRFLGKDSVLWHKKIQLPQIVLDNLRQLSAAAKPSSNGKKTAAGKKPQLFYDISSRNVNEFLQQLMPGLTAKVFRTHHATNAVLTSLHESAILPKDPEYRKWEAAVQANTQAAILCNHTKQAPANWTERKKRFRDREKSARERISALQKELKRLKESLPVLKREARARIIAARGKEKKTQVRERYEMRIAGLEKRITDVRLREEKAHLALGKIQTQAAIAMNNRSWNLGTSQKSYIDPRVYYNWGKKVDYDVLEKYYSKQLQRKFMWVKEQDPDYEPEEEEN
ncbi:MAG TPA: DNA topoisomerase I [bacterium]|jgi:DNA topoisomerase-1|nr:DNA topoisomerase I [bacterium]HNT65523.1 DNA topoisomerase I [bacterium]HOX87419.1 DNA topoisomerase I [bacterium]HPG46880.1 DNA topoisomerase I [bacterium]HPM99140.1 DNA topoisomerase I [bacterium]